jgi:hypothetical protein
VKLKQTIFNDLFRNNDHRPSNISFTRPFALVIFIFLHLCGCSSSPYVKAPAEKTITTVNMGKNFELFWRDAAKRDFNDQVSAWETYIEKDHQEFYHELVWQKPQGGDWQKKRLLKLAEIFKRYRAAAPRIIEEFHNFEKTVASQMGKFKEKFPDSHFDDILIYAAAAPTFNGKYSFLGKQKLLAFGVDLSVLLDNKVDILFSHELFHVYHNRALKIDKNSFGTIQFSIPLWAEGLATFVSKEMNPQASPSDVFMDKALGSIEEKHIRELAQMYLIFVNTRLEDNENESKKWFSGGTKLNDRFPPRMGYWLGYHVAKCLHKKHSLLEMSKWRPEQAHKNVVLALTALSKGKVEI